VTPTGAAKSQRATCDSGLRHTRVQVTDVQFINARFARVTFTVDEHALTSDAVFENGRWRVGQNALTAVISARGATCTG